MENSINVIKHLSSPKPGHTTGGSGRGARRGGGAGSGRTGCQQNYSPRRQASLVPPKASKKRRFNVSPEARQAKSYVNRWRNKITGWPTVHLRLIILLLTSGPAPFCLCKPFSCFMQGMFGNFSILNIRFQSPGIPRAGRVEAAHGGVAGQGGAGQDGMPTGRFVQG